MPKGPFSVSSCLPASLFSSAVSWAPRLASRLLSSLAPDCRSGTLVMFLARASLSRSSLCSSSFFSMRFSAASLSRRVESWNLDGVGTVSKVFHYDKSHKLLFLRDPAPFSYQLTYVALELRHFSSLAWTLSALVFLQCSSQWINLVILLSSLIVPALAALML